MRKQNGTTAAAGTARPRSRGQPILPPPLPPPSCFQQDRASLGLQFATLFERTPYENAPLEVQQGTLRNAQYTPRPRQTFYNGEIDGIPGPAAARAIAAFQNNAGLAQSGRLDLDTLNALRLLPNAGPPPVRRVIVQPFYPPPPVCAQPRIVPRKWVD